jgi:multidrug efflux pump subunit AcrB
MIWLVLVALRRPLSVAVMALLMLVLGVLSFVHMNTDIFPAINLPVVMMVWNYPGLSPYDMERRMVTISERALSTTVNAIEHMESESLLGIGIVKIYFQPGADPGSSMAQISAVSNTILHQYRIATDHLLQRFERHGSSTKRVVRCSIGSSAI